MLEIDIVELSYTRIAWTRDAEELMPNSAITVYFLETFYKTQTSATDLGLYALDVTTFDTTGNTVFDLFGVVEYGMVLAFIILLALYY